MLAAPALPVPHPDALAVLLAAGIGIAAVVGVVSGLVAAADARVVVALALLGAGLVAAGLDAAGVGAAATPFEAVAYGCAGVAFALVFDAPALALALPLFVAGADLIALAGGAGAATFGLAPLARRGRPRPRAARLGRRRDRRGAHRDPEVVFLAAYATYARRTALREGAAAAGMGAALLAVAAAEVLADVRLPALALLGAGFLAPNADRLRALVAR